MSADAEYRFDQFLLVPARRQLLADGQPVPLGGRAIDLLQALVERHDRTVSKNELLDLVWPDLEVEEANLPVQVSAIRKVLGREAIATVPGRGYRFVAPLDAAPMHVASHEEPAPSELPRLPAPPLPLIGRDVELCALAARVREHAIVTVTGAGGIGKTRLALAVAQSVAHRWKDGVAWVEAASVTAPNALPQAVALSLRLTLAGVATPELLAAALKGRSMLLLLDNVEHLIEGAGQLVRTLRDSAPGIHVLVTSQEAMRITGEEVFRLTPLSLPGPNDVPDERFSALALFAERARAVDRRFQIDGVTGPVVADICRQVDALPLAIELAAARVPLLGALGLRERLAERLRLLTSGPRDASRRHHTLRAALEWSHALLTAAEQTVLRRLGVFVGGFTLELAQRVAADAPGGTLDEWAVLEALGGLVDKSLVSVDAQEPVRYRLLETMRFFALERLVEAGESPVCRAAHAQAVTDLFLEVDEGRWGDAGTMSTGEAARRLRAEVDNARAALAWAIDAGVWPLAIALAGAAAPLYVQLGLIRELLPTLRALLTHVELAGPTAQINLLLNLARSGLQAGMTLGELHALKEDAVRRARAAGGRRRLQAALASLGFALVQRGEIDNATIIIAELLALERADDPARVRVPRMLIETVIHERRSEFEQAIASLESQRALLQGEPELIACESNLAMFLNDVGRYQEAADIGLGLLARPDLPRHFIHVTSNTAHALVALGRVDEARRILHAHRDEIAASPIGLHSAEALGMLCIAEGRIADAVRIDGALESYGRRTANQSNTLTQQFRDRLRRAVAAAALETHELEQWRREGEALSDEAAVDLALR